MTQYPECYFARELGLCYGVIATVTDYDVGVPSDIVMQPSSMKKVLKVFHSNTAQTVSLISRLATRSIEIMTCNCAGSNTAEEYYKHTNK